MPTEQRSPDLIVRDEMKAFVETTPEYFGCFSNKETMLRYMKENQMAFTCPNAKKAFKALWQQGALQSKQEALATMSAEELKVFASEYGEPVKDTYGNLIGYNWDESVRTTIPDTRNRSPRTLMRATMSHPEDLNRMPTYEEFHLQWSTNRQQEWLVASGYWGKNLPKELQGRQ